MPILKVWDEETQKYIGIHTIKGDKGEKGEKGDIGPQGPQGAQGLQGPQGEPGVYTKVNGIAPDETGNVTLTAADVGALAVSEDGMTGPINMNGHPISGLNDPTENSQAARKGYVDAAKAEAKAYTNASVRKAAPWNLLDNSDFSNPVNQRGAASYSTSGYTIDRWMGRDNATIVDVGNGCVTVHKPVQSSVTAGIRQKVANASKLAGKTLTLVCNPADGSVAIAIRAYNEGTQIGVAYSSKGSARLVFTVPANIKDGNLIVLITSNVQDANTYAKFKSVGLYEGEYTAETLPEYQPKGYAAELAECQRYYLKLLAQASGFASSTNTALFPVSTPVQMWKTPTVLGKVNWLRTEGTQLPSSNIADATFSSSTPAGNGVVITLTGATGLTQHKAIYIAVSNFALSADL